MRLFLLALAATTVLTETAPSRKDVVLLIEGLLEGIMQDEGKNYTDIVECITDTAHIGENIEAAFKELEKETLEGVKQALKDIAAVAREVPQALKDCHVAETDLQKIAEMAEIFEHPIQLVYRVGHNLVVNGADIYEHIMNARQSKRSGDYLEVGRALGEAFDEVFFKMSSIMTPENIYSQLLKQSIRVTTNDERAFRFLRGFFESLGILE